ncbi:MAG TPA: aminoglycoside 3'-phosphotransferase [Mycobacteriales bacterium]|nr:aminoglycoside 3'-phosphotransferase [Mycobacteriales bacterium]
MPPEDRVPRAVRVAAGRSPLTPIWRNDRGGLTYRLGADRFIKWAPHGEPALDIASEERRLHWAGEFAPVPTVVASGADSDGSWMVTGALPGQNALAPRWITDPKAAVAAIGRSVRALHDALPVESCPFSGSWVGSIETPPADQLVVCHGDPCGPNILLDDAGQCTGYVDLGDLGVADRWADLAVTIWNVESNFGPEWKSPLLQAYGVAPDPTRLAFYRRLWDRHIAKT